MQTTATKSASLILDMDDEIHTDSAFEATFTAELSLEPLCASRSDAETASLS